jgi:hypothetical protein
MGAHVEVDKDGCAGILADVEKSIGCPGQLGGHEGAGPDEHPSGATHGARDVLGADCEVGGLVPVKKKVGLALVVAHYERQARAVREALDEAYVYAVGAQLETQFIAKPVPAHTSDDGCSLPEACQTGRDVGRGPPKLPLKAAPRGPVRTTRTMATSLEYVPEDLAETDDVVHRCAFSSTKGKARQGQMVSTLTTSPTSSDRQPDGRWRRKVGVGIPSGSAVKAGVNRHGPIDDTQDDQRIPIDHRFHSSGHERSSRGPRAGCKNRWASPAGATDKPSAGRVHACRTALRTRLPTGHTSFQIEAVSHGCQHREARTGEVTARRGGVGVEPIEELKQHAPSRRFRRSYREEVPRPAQGHARRFERVEVGHERGAHADEPCFFEPRQVAASVVEPYGQGVHGLEGTAHATGSLSRSRYDRSELADPLCDERRDDVALAHLHDADNERVGVE